MLVLQMLDLLLEPILLVAYFLLQHGKISLETSAKILPHTNVEFLVLRTGGVLLDLYFEVFLLQTDAEILGWDPIHLNIHIFLQVLAHVFGSEYLIAQHAVVPRIGLRFLIPISQNAQVANFRLGLV